MTAKDHPHVGAALAAAARSQAEEMQRRAVEQLSAMLGGQVELNEHGAIELTDEQIDWLVEHVATRPADPSGLDQFLGVPIWRKRDH